LHAIFPEISLHFSDWNTLVSERSAQIFSDVHNNEGGRLKTKGKQTTYMKFRLYIVTLLLLSDVSDMLIVETAAVVDI
jgi:hypothetical protein